MAEDILGLDFDIHGGGLDLVFPHHENEIAQTEAARGRPLARHWMHNGMVEFGEEKMAKSVGNIRLLSEVLDEFGRDALIMYFLGGHYGKPLAFSPGNARAGAALAASGCGTSAGWSAGPAKRWPASPIRSCRSAGTRSSTRCATTSTLRRRSRRCSSSSAEGNRRLESGEPLGGAADALAEMLDVIGLETLLEDDGPTEEEAGRLAEERERARREGDFERADAIRRELAERGYEVRDTDEGPVLVPLERTGEQPSIDLRAQPRAWRRSAGRRRVRRIWRSDDQAAAPPSSERDVPRLGARSRGARASSAARPITRASSPRSIRTPTSTPRALLDSEEALVVALDQVQDPQNLGAICRTAEAAGVDGGRVAGAALRRRHARGLQGLGRSGRAPARSRACGTSPISSARPASAAPGSTGRPRRPPIRYTDVDYRGRAVLVLGGEGAGLRPRVQSGLRPAGLDPDGRQNGVAERLGGGRRAALRGAAAAGGRKRALTNP